MKIIKLLMIVIKLLMMIMIKKNIDDNDVIHPLCVILPQMSGHIKYFDDGGKNMSFVTDDKKVYEKYDEIWNVVKSLLKLKFAASPIRDDRYILAKLKIFKKKNLTTFNNNNVVPMEKNHYICITAIDIDSVLKIDKKAYPQAYLEECKYKSKKRKPVSFIDSEIIDDDDDDDDDDDSDDDGYDIDNSIVKWGLLACNEVGLFQIFDHVKTIKNH